MKKTFFLFNLSLEIILEISFLTLNNIEINFLKLKFFFTNYILTETILTTKHIKLEGKTEFAVAAFDIIKKFL